MVLLIEAVESPGSYRNQHANTTIPNILAAEADDLPGPAVQSLLRKGTRVRILARSSKPLLKASFRKTTSRDGSRRWESIEIHQRTIHESIELDLGVIAR